MEEWYQQCQGDQCGYEHLASGATEGCHDDSRAGCRRRSLLGECHWKPEWMDIHCPESCGRCGPTEPGDEKCYDLHTLCPQWATAMECFANPAFMSRSCRKSCWLCMNATELRQEGGISEEDILRRFQYSKTNFGVWQAIPDNDNAGRIRDTIKEMGSYAMSLPKLGPGTLCNNVHYECSQWVVELGSCETNLDFMLPRCSLACQACHLVEEYHQCKRRDGSVNEGVPAGEMAVFRNRLFKGVAGTTDLLDGLEDVLDFEWIASVKYSRIWKHAERRLRDIVKTTTTTKNLLWSEADVTPVSQSGPHGKRSKRSGRVASCDSRCQKSEANIQALVSDIAQFLRISPTYFEPLEFVHYQRGERFAAHSDFRVTDSWRHAGHRILTVFVVLQKAKIGGSMGFPEYDWLKVKNGEILVWPNVNEQQEEIQRMKSEQLPVVEGDLYGVYLRVRQYPFNIDNPCA